MDVVADFVSVGLDFLVEQQLEELLELPPSGIGGILPCGTTGGGTGFDGTELFHGGGAAYQLFDSHHPELCQSVGVPPVQPCEAAARRASLSCAALTRLSRRE